MLQSPLKRALRNAITIVLVVGLAVYLQGTTVAASIMSMIYTLIVVFPILWITYRYTHNIRMKYEAERQADTAEKSQEPNNLSTKE